MAPPAVAERAERPRRSIVPGEALELEPLAGVEVAALAAYNTSKRDDEGQLFHPREAGCVGFDLNVRGERLYHAGDTDVIPEMDSVVGVDVALLPVSGTYVMTAERGGRGGAPDPARGGGADALGRAHRHSRGRRRVRRARDRARDDHGSGLTRAVAALTALGALVRFATLDAKGFWEDEATTAILMRADLFDLIGTQVRESEATPPLFYALEWPVAQALGSGEVALRLLPALFGTAAIPFAYLAGRELVSERAGVAAAALVAVNPLLVWYSQEARAYSLLVLLVGRRPLLFARA